jgi:hypothetical protein
MPENFTLYPPVVADPAGHKSPEEIAAMSPAARLDYAQKFDQSKMPPWRDPRGG